MNKGKKLDYPFSPFSDLHLHSRTLKKLQLILFLLALSFASQADDFFEPLPYPDSVYRNPVNSVFGLAGNFGECRPNHFHSGLDVRTEQRENMDIHSIQKGYIARVSLSSKGFGHCIYVAHPEGFTSVYAHLNDFFPALALYVKARQYERKTWELELDIPPHLFPIPKGFVIAKSGNTGSSHAPHLHMEIRETKTNTPVNGLLFYGEHYDTENPVIKNLAVYDGSKSIYMQQPRLLPSIFSGGHYTPGANVVSVQSDKAYFGVYAKDYMEESLRLGVFKMEMYVDGKPYFGWRLNGLHYDDTRYMNAIGDYKTRMDKGFWVQLCHRLPHDSLQIYKAFTKNNGVIDLSDEAVHDVKIQVFDVKGNKAEMIFKVQGKAQASSGKKECSNDFGPGKKNIYKGNDIEVIMGEKHFYDDFCFSVAKLNGPVGRATYRIGQPNVPVHDTFLMRFKYPVSAADADKVMLYYTPHNDTLNPKGFAATYKNGWVECKSTLFGYYSIVLDKKKPDLAIRTRNGATLKTGSTISCIARDELTKVKKFTATLENGQWLRFVKYKNRFYYKTDKHFPEGEHTLTITAEDMNGNKNTKTLKLNRVINDKFRKRKQSAELQAQE